MSKTRNTKTDKSLQHAVLDIQDNAELEAFAKKLSAEELGAALELLKNSEAGRQKLSPILMGTPEKTFAKLLQNASPSLLFLLQQEDIADVVQHQLTLLAHTKKETLKTSLLKFSSLEHEIKHLNLDLLNEVWETLDSFAIALSESIKEIVPALRLVWNTRRLDLIDCFSSAKETTEKLLIFGIGHPLTHDRPATGLYDILERKMLSVYGSEESENATHSFQDEEPVAEALTKLSICYLEDYWEVGLLPQIASKDLLKLEAHSSENEQAEYRNVLLHEAKKRLEDLGLKCVRDLKYAHIYTKNALSIYIKNHINFL